MVPQEVGGGGVTLFTYIRRLGSFLGFNILSFNIFGGFQKNKYFLGMKILWVFFGVITNWTIFRVISMYFRVFSYGHSTEWGFFWGC